MRWTFLAPSLSRPAGGLVTIFHIANALARAGALAQIVHLPGQEARLSSAEQIRWFEFEPEVEHHFAARLAPDAVPSADVLVLAPMTLSLALAAEDGPAARALVDAVESPAAPLGQPVLYLQGHGVFPPEVEDLALGLPGPKVCVGSWLTDLVAAAGIRRERILHVPNGIDHRVFRIVRDIADRPPQVAMNFDPHPVKGGTNGLGALTELHCTDGVSTVAFGTRPPPDPPAGTTFVLAPDQLKIADTIYNASTIYLQPSLREGFGLCAVEAMASGCALVTTANGGSDDYAQDGETALVCGSSADEMAEAVRHLLRDDVLRARLATNGAAFVDRFRWSSSAEQLARMADAYLAEPERLR